MARWNLTGLLGHAMRRRCPVCGSGKPFTGWFRMTPECPNCAYRYEREDGYWVGAMIVNMAVTEVLFGIVFVAAAVASWPDVPWVPLLVMGAAMNVLIPTFFYPFSKTIWVALDIYLNPPPRTGPGSSRVI